MRRLSLLVAFFGLAGLVLVVSSLAQGGEAFAAGQSRPGQQWVIYTNPGAATESAATATAVRLTGSFDGSAPQTALVAAATTGPITVTYRGFPADAQGSFQWAVDVWNTTISSTVPIKVVATWEPLGRDLLGSAGAADYQINFTGAPRRETWYSVALANALAGRDLNGATEEIQASFNSADVSWYFGTDGRCPNTKYDFASTVLHEIAHGLGFDSDLQYSRGSGTVNDGPQAFDHFVANGSGQILWSSFTAGSALGAQLISNNVYFTGPKAQVGNGGRPAKLFAPNPWQNGSSIAHLDRATYPQGTINAMMTSEGAPGEVTHDIGPVTWGIFQDIGWTAAAAPSPTPSPTAIPTPAATPAALRPNKVFLPGLFRD